MKKKNVKDLLAWYSENKRDLPWRHTKDSYKIWISETMLQQTRVETVIPYYERFIREIPDIQSLAYAGEDQLTKLWQGLGYYSRVRNMKKCARVCMEKYEGKLPPTKKELEQLPGIGSYTAGAIASIAYDEKVSAVDGNVIRVFSRLYNIQEDVKSSKVRKRIESLVENSSFSLSSFPNALSTLTPARFSLTFARILSNAP